MSAARVWFPCGSLASRPAARRFVAIVGEWGRIWFSRDAWQAGEQFSQPTPSDKVTLREKSRLALLGGPKTVVAMAHAMLGQPMRGDPTPGDVRVLQRLAGTALDDLVVRLEALFPPRMDAPLPAVGQTAAKWHLSIGPAAAGLALQLDSGDLAELARAGFAPIAPAADLQPLRSALEDLELTASGMLGTIPLTLSDLAALEPGDILLLDQTPDTEVELLLENTRTATGCALTQTEGQLALTFQGVD